MASPILYNISAFDKNHPQVFKFSYQGNQAFKNRLIIRDNITNAVVYDQTQTTFKLQHDLPENTLTNGKLYNARLSVFDSGNVESLFSGEIIFYCFSAPVFGFGNIVENQVIENSTYTALLNYSQSESESLNEYQVVLYDHNMAQIYSSGVSYQTLNLQVTLNNLEDNKKYYVKATGKTLNGMYVDTGAISFSVDYLSPIVFSTVTLENQYFEGNIKISANMYSILGTSNPDPPVFIDNNEVDLTETGSWVKFDENFKIVGDFTLQGKGRNFNDYSTILHMDSNKTNLELKYMKGEFEDAEEEQAFMILRVFNKITNYELISNYIRVPSPTDDIFFWIRHIGGIYELKIGVIG